MRKLLSGIVVALAILVFAGTSSQARVVELHVVKAEPAFEGRTFGDVGAYQKIVAQVKMAVKPEDARNAGIVDLELAPKNAKGEVEFSTEVEILRPTDLKRGSGKIFYDVLNRGRKLGLAMMNDAPFTSNPTKAAEAGNGFLMEQGYTIVWSGWQGDQRTEKNLIGVDVPAIPGITGDSREEFIFDNLKNPVTAELSYPAADLDPSRAVLTVRARATDEPAKPAGLAFKYLSPTRIEISRPATLDAGAVYEFIYRAKDPKVLGLGFAAVRDVVSFLRYEAAAPDGTPNPLASDGQPAVRYAYSLGISQSGRFLRDLLYQGFNEDEAGRPVFDGLMPHIAGSRKTFVNYRFAQPGRYSRQHEDHFFPGDDFPFTYAASQDPHTGKTDGILNRCLQAAKGCPKVIQTDTDTEIFQARGSLIVTDGAGHSLSLPDNVRVYLLVGLQHFSFAGAKPRMLPPCHLPNNPLNAGGAMRALVVALDQWITKGITPPPSRYPGLEKGTLVALKDAGYKNLPGLSCPPAINGKNVVDYRTLPPKIGPEYAVLAARVDADGHAVAGIRLPAIEAPIATYLGWNPRKTGFAACQLCSTNGATIAIAKTKAERQAKGDPRPSLEERYPTPEAYTAAVKAAADKLVKDRLLLPADAARIVNVAATTGTSQPAQ